MNPDERVAVKEILLDRLHTTEDDELQAALYQVLESHDELEGRRLAALRALFY